MKDRGAAPSLQILELEFLVGVEDHQAHAPFRRRRTHKAGALDGDRVPNGGRPGFEEGLPRLMRARSDSSPSSMVRKIQIGAGRFGTLLSKSSNPALVPFCTLLLGGLLPQRG